MLDPRSQECTAGASFVECSEPIAPTPSTTGDPPSSPPPKESIAGIQIILSEEQHGSRGALAHLCAWPFAFVIDLAEMCL